MGYELLNGDFVKGLKQMNRQLFYISEEHISESATTDDAFRIVALMRAEGWPVVYGDKPWQFDDDAQRTKFEQAFQWALLILKAEKLGQADSSLPDLVLQRIQLNGRLQPHEASLMQKRPWKGYWKWLIETPTDVILNWLKVDKQKDVPKN